MLIAALNKKLKRQIKLWEDEVTSSVFGEMRHLPVKDIWTFFCRLVPASDRQTIGWPMAPPDKAVFHFWRRNRVEPDLCVDFFLKGNHYASLLIEVKWDAMLSPKCELVRQWSDWPHKDIPTIHLYIVKNHTIGQREISQSLQIAKSQCGSFETPCCESWDSRRSQVKESAPVVQDWQQRLFCIGWRNLLNQEKGLSPAGKVWAQAVSAFLGHQGFVAFSGFHWLSDDRWSETVLEPVVFFTADPWFAFLSSRGEGRGLSKAPVTFFD